jgi:uncharacterized protein YbbC (DUF1343 family)
MPKTLSGLDALVTGQKPDVTAEIQPKKLGLLTNQTSVTQDGTPAWEALRGVGFNILALFSPEHGLRGLSEGIIASSTLEDGTPVHSLYGQTRRPTAEMLAGLNAVVCDIQDVGARFYTYAGTVFEIVESCALAGIQVIILDRPNPLGGLVVEGPFIDTDPKTLVGSAMVPVTHGMTLGEMALMYRAWKGLKVEIEVVQVQGWTRDMLWPQTGLTWRRPSPNLPDFETAAWYPGLCLIEFCKFTVGRGTVAPFRIFGSPDFDSQTFLEHFGSPDGIRAEAIEFTPTAIPFPYADQLCHGIRFSRDSPPERPVEFGLRVMAALRQSQPQLCRENWDQAEKLLGNREVLQLLWDGDLEGALDKAERDAAEFLERRKGFLLYG